MSNKEMTAVEYLVEQLIPKALSAEQYYHIKQAKQLEKQQIIDAYIEGVTGDSGAVNAEQYYTKIYGGQNNEQ